MAAGLDVVQPDAFVRRTPTVAAALVADHRLEARARRDCRLAQKGGSGWGLAGPGRDPWLGDASLGGFEIVALRTVDDFVAESVAMENCLDQYAAHLAYGRVRIFSIRKDGRPLADVEITTKGEDSNSVALSQVRGPRNRRAAPAVWQTVHAWLAGQTVRPVDVSPTSAQATRDAFRRFWGPYVEAAEAAGLPPHVLARVLGRDARRAKPNAAPGAHAMVRTPAAAGLLDRQRMAGGDIGARPRHYAQPERAACAGRRPEPLAAGLRAMLRTRDDDD